MTYIYGLHDPVVDSIFYVGQSRDPKSRLWAHIAAAREVEKSQRILNILLAGRRPELKILQEIPESMEHVENFIRSQEMKWVNSFGNQLVNRARWGIPSQWKDFSRVE
jgi:hypothetical protein